MLAPELIKMLQMYSIAFEVCGPCVALFLIGYLYEWCLVKLAVKNEN